jgi:uncharacterized protein (DUF2249 family)
VIKPPKQPDGEYRIERGIPMPKSPGASAILTALDKLEIGESILVHDMAPSDVRSRVGYAKIKHRDRNYATRTVEGGTRIWRTK